MPTSGRTSSTVRAIICTVRLCVGTCLAAPLAARSGKTSCSSSSDYQGQRFDHPTTSNFITVFTNAERNGDFSQLTTQLKNPITGAPYVNNQIPMSQLNPVAAALFASKFYPTPINSNLTNNAINQHNQAYNTDQGDAKIDWNITQRDRLSARWAQQYQNDPQTNSLLILGNNSTMPRFTMRSARGRTRSAPTY